LDCRARDKQPSQLRPSHRVSPPEASPFVFPANNLPNPGQRLNKRSAYVKLGTYFLQNDYLGHPSDFTKIQALTSKNVNVYIYLGEAIILMP